MVMSTKTSTMERFREEPNDDSAKTRKGMHDSFFIGKSRYSTVIHKGSPSFLQKNAMPGHGRRRKRTKSRMAAALGNTERYTEIHTYKCGCLIFVFTRLFC